MSDLQGDFNATRATAAQGGSGTDFLNQLAGGGGAVAQNGAPTSSPASGGAPPAAAPSPASKPPAAPLSPVKPFGLSWSDAWNNARNLVMAKPEDRDATLGDALRKGITGIPAEIGNQFMDALRGLKADALPQNLKDLQHALSSPLGPAGTAAGDAIQAAFAPITGTLTSAVGRPVEELTGVKRDVTGTILSLLAPGGVLGKAGKAGELAGDAAKGEEIAGGAAEAGGAAAPKPAEAAAAATTPDAAPRAFDIAGEKPGASLKITPEIRAKAADFLAGNGTSPIDVHLETLANPETRVQAISDIAKVIPKDAVKSIDTTQANAYALNLSHDEVISKLRPAIPSDEIAAAAYMATEAASEQLWVKSRAAMASADPQAAEEAVRAYSLANDYVGAMRDGSTDWGRAGRIRQEAARQSSDLSKQVKQIIEDVGPDDPQEAIRRISALDDPRKVSPLVSTWRWMKGRQGMLYGWYNWLLSNPAIIGKKLLSDASLGVFNIATRYTAEKFGSGAVPAGETMALIRGYTGSMGDAFKMAGKALKAGQSQFHGEYNSLFDGSLLDRRAKLANGAPEGFADGNVTGAALEYMRMAMPTSWIGAADDFAKVMNYRAELHASAFRQATQEAALAAKKGAAPEMSVSDRAAQLINNPQPAMHEDAVARAERNTLQEPLDGVAASMQDWVDKINVPLGKSGIEFPLGRVISPFTKISSNVMRFVYRSSPLPLAFPTSTFKAAIAAGGATRDLALAQVGLGTAASMVALPFIIGGQMTGSGPTDPMERAAWLRAGNQPYSLKFAGKWYGYNHVEPFGTTLAMMSDTADIMRYAKDEDNEALAASLSLSAGHAMLSKTYMQAWSDLLDAMESPDRKGPRFVDNLMASFAVPGIISGADKAFDEYIRAHTGLMQTIAARTPGLSNTLPPVRDIWGDPIKRADGFLPGAPEGVARMLSPIPTSPADHANPIDAWVWNNRDAFPDAGQGRVGFSLPPRSIRAGQGAAEVSVPLSTTQIDRLRVLAGNGSKIEAVPGDPSTAMGAKDAFNALVQGTYPNKATQAQFNSYPPSRQAAMFLSMWGAYRARARGQLIHEDQSLQDTIKTGLQARHAILQPDVGGSQQ